MPIWTYTGFMDPTGKDLVWLKAKIKTPPFSLEARIETGVFLRMLQDGEKLSMPHSRPMPSIGRRCHELRVTDKNEAWRIVYRLDPDAVVVVEVFSKKSRATPKSVIDTCKKRLKQHDETRSGK
jgi:phage-related protein